MRGPEMAPPTPPTLVAPRRSRGAPRFADRLLRGGTQADRDQLEQAAVHAQLGDMEGLGQPVGVAAVQRAVRVEAEHRARVVELRLLARELLHGQALALRGRRDVDHGIGDERRPDFVAPADHRRRQPRPARGLDEQAVGDPVVKAAPRARLPPSGGCWGFPDWAPPDNPAPPPPLPPRAPTPP